MPDIQKIKLDFQTVYAKSEQNPRMQEEELRTLFNKGTILENLGHSTIGKDIRLELSIKGKRSDTDVDSEVKAEYLETALAARKVNMGEKIKILVSLADALAKEAVAQRQKDVQDAQGIVALEDEINELVYKLYGLDENDKKVIEEFLGKF